MTTPTWIEVKETDLIVRWETPGQVLEGIFHGGKPAGDKKNTLYLVTDPDGHEQKTWETFMLRDKLEHVPVGNFVRIEYLGISGKTKLFSVRHRLTGG